LERLKGKLAAEGLFEPGRKKPLPEMPAVVGVITSPTGAVIRDILHRIRDRWPCRVIVWPVVVQGDAAAGQVRAAIEGFNALGPGSALPRPDVLIVARGGGSVEDLWPFNDEALARCVAASEIPLISAVGHETDTTLIDFVSDRRAPTPTAAAEIATPVLAELRGLVADLSGRMHRSGGRLVEERRGRIEALGRSLARVPDLVELAGQRFNHATARLGAGLERNVAAHRVQLVRAGSRLTPGLLQRPQAVQAQRLGGVAARLHPAAVRGLERTAERLASLAKLYQSVDPDRPLARGFARVHRAVGSLVRSAQTPAAGEAVRLVFGDGARGAVIDGEPGAAAAPAAAPKPAKAAKPPPTPSNQGDLF
jgi:exodeoxyribonuclease VII large subunit